MRSDGVCFGVRLALLLFTTRTASASSPEIPEDNLRMAIGQHLPLPLFALMRTISLPLLATHLPRQSWPMMQSLDAGTHPLEWIDSCNHETNEAEIWDCITERAVLSSVLVNRFLCNKQKCRASSFVDTEGCLTYCHFRSLDIKDSSSCGIFTGLSCTLCTWEIIQVSTPTSKADLYSVFHSTRN